MASVEVDVAIGLLLSLLCPFSPQPCSLARGEVNYNDGRYLEDIFYYGGCTQSNDPMPCSSRVSRLNAEPVYIFIFLLFLILVFVLVFVPTPLISLLWSPQSL